uniref:Glycosyltransferase n=1 Tax=viral metagenome TaxID=1070528 RepID=A0A6C0AJ98_9ZZZZ
MKILVVDQHAGCQMWQAALLKELGHDVTIDSSSGHAHLIPSNWKRNVIVRDNGIIVNGDELAREFDTVVAGFPPNFMNEFKNIRFRHKKIINCGHRFHIQPSYGPVLMDDVFLASMSRYDAEYIKHYTGITPHALDVACFHLPRTLAYRPTRKEILISPVHAQCVLPFSSLEHMNSMALQDGSDLVFSRAHHLYGNFKYEDLVNHPACVLFPYSAFSISMIEMYELNIPMFVPSPSILTEMTGPKQLMNDVLLYPCYMDEREMMKRDIPHPSSPHAYSPNSYRKEDIKYWFQFTYFNTRKNVIYWNSPKDLFNKLRTTNLSEVSERMRIENEEHRAKQLDAWKICLSNI